jgi:2-polyprenyl-6-methoxyphenol hydroxylase-like FAD-dependent oxidoreductase
MSNHILRGLRFIVVGAGPGGLTFAKAARQHGAAVEVIEKAGDPGGKNAGYTDRSFNLTLNNVGRASINDSRVLEDSIEVVGRAMHNFGSGNSTKFVSYGEGDPAMLTSITRPILRQKLAHYAEEAGVNIRFNTEVTAIDPAVGAVTLLPADTGKIENMNGDLLVVADGLHSLADRFIEALPNGSLNLYIEPYNYVTAQLSKESCKGLSLNHINFWHQLERGTISIGVPNKDGSIAVLMVSRFDDVSAGVSPFETLDSSAECVQKNFPQLLELDPTLPERLAGRKRGRFHYKNVTNFVLGSKTAVVGDAGNTVPPWAAFGANTGIYGADALARFLIGFSGDVQAALAAYEQHELVLEQEVSDFVNGQGEFLSARVTEHPEERRDSPMLGMIVNEITRIVPPPPGVDLLSFESGDQEVPAAYNEIAI